MATFIDPFTDTGFKIIFGKEHVSNEILCSFLNVLFADDPVLSDIRSVEYRPSERVREWDDGKSIIYDIHCRTSTGHNFILEMQLNEQMYFLKRAFYYFCRGVAEQGYKGSLTAQDREGKALEKQSDLLSSDRENRGEGAEDGIYEREETREKHYREYWNYDFIPVVGVIFSNFYIQGLERKLVTRCRFTDSETHRPVGDYLQAVFIQLPAFTKSKEECESFFDEWLYNLIHMSTMETMAFTSHQDIFNRLAKVANLATLSPAERRQYDYDLKKARDYHAEMSFARTKAREEGRAEGRAEGIEEGIELGMEKGIEKGVAKGINLVAKALLSEGVSVDKISRYTGLTIEQIFDLQ